MIFDELHDASYQILQQIFKQPFNIELANGILPKEKFIFYIIQDALYLADFSRALALTGARLIDNDHAHQYVKFSLGAIESEKILHSDYLAKHHFVDLTSIEQSPVCFMYTNYLLKMAGTASVEEAVASLLPCFWVYYEVGKEIEKYNTHDHPYSEWIELYSSENFHQTVTSAIKIINQLGIHASNQLKQRMVSAFTRATELEWIFWEGAYQRESRFIATS